MSKAANDPPLPLLAPRAPNSHKGTYGHAVLIGGSQGMAGAIAMSGIACLRSGAGLVTLATAAPAQATAASFEPAVMTIGLPADASGRISNAARDDILTATAKATAVALGPGIGRSDELVELVGWLYAHLELPMVVDADALFALAQPAKPLPVPPAPRVLTPHPGEFARLLHVEKIEQDQRESLARQFAERSGTIVLLKGHRTVITDGPHLALNHTGNPGMATGGTGDVLTGIVTALLCQHLGAYDAARLAAHVHGLAGDLAAEALGQTSMIASDLLDFLPDAWRHVQSRAE